MLIEFRVKNLFSFNEETKLSMIPSIQNKTGTISLGNINVLRFAAIYGANASGKSNLVQAMNILKLLVYKGITEVSKNVYCRCNEENKNKESSIECIFFINGSFYAFGIKFLANAGILLEEWLSKISQTNSKEKKIYYYRKNENDLKNIFPLISKNSEDFHRLETYVFDQNQFETYTSTFIHSLIKKKFTDEKMIFVTDFEKWIDSFDINMPDQPIDFFTYMDKGEFSKVEKILSEFDTGISKVFFGEISTEDLIKKVGKGFVESLKKRLEKDKNEAGDKKKIQEIIARGDKNFFRIKLNDQGELVAKVIRLQHSEIESKFELDEESDGTVRLFDLLDIVLTGKEDMVYVVDEIDRSLHPVLLFKFIEIVKKEFAERRIQIIFTTHETHIMDLDLFRRDEIWFVEKNNKGVSNIFSLDLFKERNDKIIKNGYIDGIYGGIPLFKKIED